MIDKSKKRETTATNTVKDRVFQNLETVDTMPFEETVIENPELEKQTRGDLDKHYCIQTNSNEQKR